MPIHNSVGWTNEDFIDPVSATPVEEDPWDPVTIAEDRELTASGELEIESEAALNASAPGGRQSHSQLTLDIDDLDSGAAPLDPPLGLEAETSPLDSDVPDDWFVDDTEPDLDADLFDEPVPTAEFDPDLNDELYGPIEEIDLTDAEIRLDQFLAQLSLSDDQTSIIRSHLETFSPARLISWLPWLNSKVWTPRMLTSFVRFHSHWEAMPAWWENWWRHRRFGWTMRASPTSNILSRDDAYGIVRNRIGYSGQDAVDDLWFEEWDYYSMWRHGFWSFAKFARFRAVLNPGEDWQSLVEWADLDDDIERETLRNYDLEAVHQYIGGGILSWEDATIRYSHVSSLPSWYVIQDWYPEDEWHDNLGWSTQFADLPEPRIIVQNRES